MLEILDFLDFGHPGALLADTVRKTMEGLVKHYATIGEDDAQGLLNRGSYAVRHDVSPDDYVIWGDYFYLEALMRLERGVPGYGYWYER